jgi:O-antigen/teichoic acid export membrane protein
MLKKNHLLVNWAVLTLFGGQFAAQALQFAALPFISRVFPAGEIGIWGMFQTAAWLLWSFAQFKTDAALVRASEEEERSVLFVAGVAAYGFCSVLVFAGVQISGFSLENFDAPWILGVLPAFGFNQMVQALLMGRRQYAPLAALRIATAAVVFPGTLLCFGAGFQNGLLAAWTVGHLLPAVWFLQQKYWSGAIIRLGNWKTYWRRHKKLMTFGSAGSLLDVSADQAFLLLAAAYCPAETLAAYFLAHRFCNAPISLIAGTLGQHNFVRFQQLYREKRLNSGVLWTFWRRWWPLAALYYGALMGGGPALFRFFLGPDWQYAGTLAAISAVLGFAIFLTSPVSSIFWVLQKPEYPFYLNAFALLRLGAGAGLMLAGWPLHQILVVHVVIGLLHNLTYNFLQLRALRQGD